MIGVTAMGKGKKEIKFGQGMTVGAALKSAGVKVGKGSVVTVNGAEASEKTVLKDGDQITVTPNVSNG